MMTSPFLSCDNEAKFLLKVHRLPFLTSPAVKEKTQKEKNILGYHVSWSFKKKKASTNPSRKTLKTTSFDDTLSAVVAGLETTLENFRSDYEYECEYAFCAREA